jgi:hypothetical protein
LYQNSFPVLSALLDASDAATALAVACALLQPRLLLRILECSLKSSIICLITCISRSTNFRNHFHLRSGSGFGVRNSANRGRYE